jgi:hypothetical protein
MAVADSVLVGVIASAATEGRGAGFSSGGVLSIQLGCTRCAASPAGQKSVRKRVCVEGMQACMCRGLVGRKAEYRQHKAVRSTHGFQGTTAITWWWLYWWHAGGYTGTSASHHGMRYCIR